MTGEAKPAGILLRVVAKGIDFILVLAAAEALRRAGWLAGLGYMMISDGLFGGMSVGKKLTRLKTISVVTKRPCSTKESILRNSTLWVGILLWKIPLVGWIFLPAFAALEFIMLLGSKEGMRLGDELAKTTVVETNENEAVKEN